MACFHPLRLGRSGSDDERVVACGQCIGCRLERSRQWAMRCMHEASLYEKNCFVTLTYSESNCPPRGLDKGAFPRFMKALRHELLRSKEYAVRNDIGTRVRYFHAGEYGALFQRPHYHACLFGFDFKDKVFFSEREGIKLFVSPSLQELWPFGYSTVGQVSFESAAYVARYVTKKINGDRKDAHYEGKHPEYVTMSRRPGISRDWYTQFKDDVFPSDEVGLRGKVLRPPVFYTRILESEDLESFERIKAKRKVKALANADDNTPQRLKVKEQCKLAKFRLLKRGIEND